MRLQRTYYEVMGLPRTASPTEIKTKYHELARQFHPDRAQDKVLAERLFVQINLAYRTLMDSDKRAVYDASLFQADAAKASAARASGEAPAATAAQPRRAQNPDIVDQLSRAQAAYMGGDRIGAHKICMDVLREQPTHPEAHSLVGDIYSDQGRRQEALDEYRIAANVGGMTRLLQEKINRLQALAAQQQQQRIDGTGVPRANKPTTAPVTRSAAATAAAVDAGKKGSLFDRLLGR